MAVEPIILAEPPADAPPRKGPGRPRGRGPGRPAGKPKTDTAPRSHRATGTAVTEDAVGGLLFMFNLPLGMLPQTRGDALDPDEIAALSKAIVEQCKSSVTFRRYVQYALRATTAGGLMTALSLVLARRAMRHGLIPGGPEADAQLGGLIGVMAGSRGLGSVFQPAPSSGDQDIDLATLAGMNDNELHPPTPAPAVGRRFGPAIPFAQPAPTNGEA